MEQGAPRAAWLIRLRVDHGADVVGRVVEMAPYGLWVRLNWRLPAGLRLGQLYRAEIHSGTPHQFAFTAEVRYLDGYTVGLRPEGLFPFRTGPAWEER